MEPISKAVGATASRKTGTAPRDLSDEAAAHLTLARLLMRKRPPAQRAELRKIIESSRSTAEKVVAIRSLDERATRTRRGLAASELSRGQELPFSFAKARSVVKLPQPTVGLIRYLFRERAKILEHGYRTHTLTQALLLPVMRLDPNLADRFGDELEQATTELVRTLEVVLERGWQYLTKREYNLVVVFVRLLHVLVGTHFKLLELRDKDLLSKLQPFETLYFFLYGQGGCPDLLVDTVARVLSFQSDIPVDQVKTAMRTLRRILLRDYDLPSLFNFLLTLNMMRFRRFLTEEDLVAKHLDSMLDVSVFSASAAIREKISAYVEELKGKIWELARAKRNNERLRSYIPVDSAGTPDFVGLREFYDRGLGSPDGTAFLHDRDNVVLFVPRFLRLFDATFAPFLTGKPRLGPAEAAAVFAPEFFGGDLQRLRNIGARLDRLFFDFRSLPYRKYLGIKAGANIAIPLEREIVAALDEALAIFLAVGRRLDRILTSHRDAQPEENGRSRPLDASVLHAIAVVIPHADAKILSRSDLNGMSVKEAVRYTVLICYLVAAYLRDEQLLTTLAQGEAIQMQLESHLATLGRLVDVESYDAVVKRLLTESLESSPNHS